MSPMVEPDSIGRATSRSKAVVRRVFAVVCILMLVCVWVGLAEVTQGMEARYPKPYFLRLCVHAFYSLCLVTWAVWRFFPLPRRQKQGVVLEVDENDELKESTSNARVPKLHDLHQPHDSHEGVVSHEKIKRHSDVTTTANSARYNYLGYFNWCYFFGASIFLAIITFVSGWLWFVSLPRTSVSGNSAIYQSACTMVYLFSIIFLKERVTKLKSAAVFVSVVGVFIVSFFGTRPSPEEDATTTTRLLASQLPPGGIPEISNVTKVESSIHPVLEQHSQPSTFGYVCCFASMVLYALYEVLYKKWASHSGDPLPMMNSMRFLGLLGASSVIFLTPPLLLLDLTGIESFELPRGDDAKLVLLLGLFDTLFNLLLLFAIMLSSPLFASVGCLLVLPASVAWDYFVHSYELPFGALIGVGCIVLGFVGFLVEEYKATLSSGATVHPLYDYEVLGGLQTENKDKQSVLEIELPPPVPISTVARKWQSEDPPSFHKIVEVGAPFDEDDMDSWKVPNLVLHPSVVGLEDWRRVEGSLSSEETEFVD